MILYLDHGIVVRVVNSYGWWMLSTDVGYSKRYIGAWSRRALGILPPRVAPLPFEGMTQ